MIDTNDGPDPAAAGLNAVPAGPFERMASDDDGMLTPGERHAMRGATAPAQ